jgi:acetylornithine deacetylase/succinyl-diaminopimelate desuccinylase-like protein
LTTCVGGADPPRGSALRGLVDRVEAIGGQIEITSAPGDGTRHCAPLPTDVPGLTQRPLGRVEHQTGSGICVGCYWAATTTDAAFIAAAGIPTVMFGPAGTRAHAAEEWVSISSSETVARTLVAVAAQVCA